MAAYAAGHPEKKMLASKTKTTYFEGANNSTPFFALVMPTGLHPEYCFAEQVFQKNLPGLRLDRQTNRIAEWARL